MGLMDSEQACTALTEKEQIEFPSFVFADRLRKDPDFLMRLNHEHEAMERGSKWSHEDLKDLHEQLGEKEL